MRFAAAESMAPCVLWIDEIEKGISTDSGEGDGGVSRRVLGTLLTWMAERKRTGVHGRDRQRHLAAAAGTGAQGPLRRDLLRRSSRAWRRARRSRASISNKRGHDPAGLRRRRLARLAEGFSGAEIEQAIVSASFEARSRNETLSVGRHPRRTRTHAAAVGGHGREDRRAARLGVRARGVCGRVRADESVGHVSRHAL